MANSARPPVAGHGVEATDAGRDAQRYYSSKRISDQASECIIDVFELVLLDGASSLVISNWGHERPCFSAGKSTAGKIRAQAHLSDSIICCGEPSLLANP